MNEDGGEKIKEPEKLDNIFNVESEFLDLDPDEAENNLDKTFERTYDHTQEKPEKDSNEPVQKKENVKMSIYNQVIGITCEDDMKKRDNVDMIGEFKNFEMDKQAQGI